MFENYSYEQLINIENILRAWEDYSSGKSGKKEIAEFWLNQEKHIFALHYELEKETYKHSHYKKFVICDPKERIIHKSTLIDRIVHQTIYNYLNPIFEDRFIFDSYASIKCKGNHLAVKNFRIKCLRESCGGRIEIWVLKCDVKKFFDSIDHKILFSFIEKQVKDEKILKLVKHILVSYNVSYGKGLPLGNLTSQLFANIYLHELDYYVKHILKVKNYIRFNDDFVIISEDQKFLQDFLTNIKVFLFNRLKLSLPDNKTSIRKFKWGIDFLGYIVLPGGLLPRRKTKKECFAKLKKGLLIT
jgi:retron-type reverse transcriptase